MKSQQISFLKERAKRLTPKAKYAISMLRRICKWLHTIDGREYCVEVNCLGNDYEAEIFVLEHIDCDEARCRKKNPRWMVAMWGGHFNKYSSKWANESAAWVSLLEDVIGIGELGDHHKLSKYYEDEHPEVRAIDCKSFEELELKLAAWGF